MFTFIPGFETRGSPVHFDKYEAVDIGKKLYDKYCAGVITTEDEFKKQLKEVQIRG